MSCIFVSYAHDDAERVNPIVDQLKRHFHVWIDEAGIKQGDEWYATIQKNLRQSDAILVFVSDQSQDRPWVLHEIEEGRKHDIPCHPYLIEKISAVPKGIRETQYIDGSQPDAFERLMDELPQTARIQGHHIIDAALIGTATKFSEVIAELPDDAYLSGFDGVNYNLPLIGLPLRLTRYCKIFLVGRSDDTLEAVDKVQLCALMSGRDHTYRDKVVVDVANHVLTRPDAPLRMLLVEGPLQNALSDNEPNSYGLDVERPDEWRDAYQAIKVALSFYPRATPQIFFNGPGVLLYPVGADRRDHANFELFQLKYGSSNYYRVLWHDLIFGS